MTRVVEHLSRLICIPSVSAFTNRPVTDYATSVFAAHQWTTREIPYIDDSGTEKINLIAAPPGQSSMQRDVDLAFLCHTDTVPYASDWSAALEPTRRGDSLHGCGACDVKGFLACLLTAAAGKDITWIDGLRIVLSADEEIGCLGTKRIIAMDALRPRRMVIGEPTSLHGARAGKGYCLATIAVIGREAHSALPDQGISSIYASGRLISAIEELSKELAAELHPFFHPPFTTMSIGTLSGGSAKNIIPGRTDLLIEWRPIPGQPRDRVPVALQAMLNSLRAEYPGLHTDLSILREQAGFETAADSPLVSRIERATGHPAASIAFGSEASAWSAIADEVVVFGPGDMRTAHSNRECVPLHELDAAVHIIHQLMQAS